MFDPLPDELLVPVCVLLAAVYCMVGFVALRGYQARQSQPAAQQ